MYSFEMFNLLRTVFVLLLCVSCSHDSSLEEDVYQLKSNPILINWNRMECIEDEFDTVSFHRDPIAWDLQSHAMEYQDFQSEKIYLFSYNSV